MAVAQRYVARQSGGRGGPSGLADVLDVLLDKGLVIDAFVRVSLVGIELLTIDARVVIAGVDTYLHFAEAVNRLDLLQVNSGETLGEMVGGGKRATGNSAEHQQREVGKSNGRALERGRDDDEQRTDDDKQRGRAGGPGDDRGGDDGTDDRGGKGLLSRIVERGQAF